MNLIAAAIASTATSELVRHLIRKWTTGPSSADDRTNTKIGEEYMPHWEEIMGDDDDFGEIGAELDLVAAAMAPRHRTQRSRMPHPDRRSWTWPQPWQVRIGSRGTNMMA